MKRAPKPVSPEMAMTRLEALCAASEQCSSDLLKKMNTWQIPADEAMKILDSLISRRFVDDDRFARAYARDKMRFSHWGHYKIRMGLAAKRISRHMIDDALNALDNDEYRSMCIATLRSKVRSAAIPCDYDGRTRLFRFGAARGFESQLLSNIIRSGAPWAED